MAISKDVQRVIACGIGATAGIGVGGAIRAHYPSQSELLDMREHGLEGGLSESDMIGKIAPIGVVLGASIGVGCLRAQASNPGGFATGLMAAGAIATGPSLSTLTGSNGNSEQQLTTLGVATAVGLAGFALGRMSHQTQAASVATNAANKFSFSASAGVAALGLAGGMVVPWAIPQFVSSFEGPPSDPRTAGS